MVKIRNKGKFEVCEPKLYSMEVVEVKKVDKMEEEKKIELTDEQKSKKMDEEKKINEVKINETMVNEVKSAQ